MSIPYFLRLEVVWGQTIGKRIFDLQVVSSDGTLNTPWQAVVRNRRRPGDGMTLIAVFLIPGLVTHKRLGDIAADTVVGTRAKPQEGQADGFPHVQIDTAREIIVPGSDQRAAGDRIIAGCVDIVPAFFFGCFVIAFWILIYRGMTGQSLSAEQIPDGILLLELAVAMAVYHPTLEMIWRTTLGRRLLKLRVATTRGTTPVKAQLFVKNILRPIDYIVLPITGLFIALTKRYQRPSDMIAGTVVGKRQPTESEETDVATGDGRTEEQMSPQSPDHDSL